MNISNLIMYMNFYKKNIYLNFLKKTKRLDFVGRFAEQNADLRGYEGCYPVKKILKKLDITKDDSILDIGCGKGLFLFYARRFNFCHIDGIEYSNELSKCAEKNILKLNDARIKVFNVDARKFDDFSKYNYFFINNPFSADIMKEVACSIKKSYIKHKRRIVIIYQFPFSVDVFLNNGFSLIYDKFPNAVLTFEA